MGPRELPEKVLKKVWLALDDDSSGQLKVGEFGAFMNLAGRGRSDVEMAVLRREQLHAANKKASEKVRAEQDKLFNRDIARSMSGETPATHEEVCSPRACLFSKPHTRQPPALANRPAFNCRCEP